MARVGRKPTKFDLKSIARRKKYRIDKEKKDERNRAAKYEAAKRQIVGDEDRVMTPSERGAHWRLMNPKKAYWQGRESTWRRAGLDMDRHKYRELLEDQEYLCAICRRKESESGNRRFHVDHCHETGLVRGLLCNVCNRSLTKHKTPQACVRELIYLYRWAGFKDRMYIREAMQRFQKSNIPMMRRRLEDPLFRKRRNHPKYKKTDAGVAQ